MKSFVDKFDNKRIAIEELRYLLERDYQQDCLLELALENDEIKKGTITKEDHKWFTIDDITSEKLNIELQSLYLLSLSNNEFTFFILLANDEYSIKKINTIEENTATKLITIVLDDRVNSIDIKNRVYVSSIDWLNRIISHGISPKILQLQFIRDYQYFYKQ